MPLAPLAGRAVNRACCRLPVSRSVRSAVGGVTVHPSGAVTRTVPAVATAAKFVTSTSNVVPCDAASARMSDTAGEILRLARGRISSSYVRYPSGSAASRRTTGVDTLEATPLKEYRPLTVREGASQGAPEGDPARRAYCVSEIP